MNARSSRYDLIRPFFELAVALATGDSTLFGARHLAQLPDWQILWQSDDSGHLRVHLAFISAFSYP
jgi:hypothetical protein